MKPSLILAGLAIASMTAVVLAGQGATPADEAGFVSLFDGRALAGWRLVDGTGSGYLVRDNTIVCPKDGGGKLFTEREYGDFVFRFEFRTEPGGNNGIGIRAPYEGDAAYTGMEIQILDDGHALYKGKIRSEQHHGSIYDVIPARTVINITGSLVMGLIAGWFALTAGASQDWRLFLTTGILGGYTTFSAFSLDAALLYERGELGQAAFYVVGSVVLSIAGLFAGLWLVRAFS